MPAYLHWNWDLEIQRNPMELGEPYELYFFLGPVPPLPSEWRYSRSRLFEPMMSRADTITQEFRDLNGYLDFFGGGTLNDNDVIPYLHQRLCWRAKKRFDDEEIDISRLKSLKVTLHGPDGPTPFVDGTCGGC